MAHSADDTRQRLLEAAGEVFATKGFRAATVREICGRANANVAAVNYHFGDKERLYVEAVKHVYTFGMDGPPPEWPLDMPPAERLRQVIRHMLAQVLDDRRPAWHTQLMFHELAEPTQACEDIVEGFIRPRAERLYQVLAEMLPPSASSIDRHLIAFSIIGQCRFYFMRNPFAVRLVGREEYATYDIDRLTEHISRFTLAALGHERPFCSHRQPQRSNHRVEQP
jgi:AcrR family transcriptional regulator